MNERTKQLAEWDAANRKHIADLTDTYIKNLVVTTGIYDCITDPYDALKNGDQYSSVMPDLVKFAEMIVKECCDMFVELRTRPADLAVKDVKKHFGVKE